MSTRREFMTLLGCAATAWPIAARAQQTVTPVVGLLRSSTEDGFAHLVSAFRRGRTENGYVDGRNIIIDFRWADDRLQLLPALVADLIGRKATVIVANYGAMAPLMAATQTIPIVFVSGEDPVTGGLVSTLHRPGGNVTGVTFFDVPLAGKRLSLLPELLPGVSLIALLLDADFPGAQMEQNELQKAAQAMGRQVLVVKAEREGEFSSAFSAIARSGAGALLVGGGPLLTRERRQIVALAARSAIPACYVQPEFVRAGGLMSYGASQADAYHRAGTYVSRILRGENPAELPVQLPTRFELALNLKTAKALGIDVPPTLLARADEVIE